MGSTKADERFLQAPPLSVIRTGFQFASFWLAIALPLLYIPLLFGGIQAGEVTAFSLMLVGNAVALVFGHGYGT